MSDTNSPHPTIHVNGVTRTVDARLFKLMSRICASEPQRVTLSEIAAAIDAGFKIALFARTQDFGVVDKTGMWIMYPSIATTDRARFNEMLDHIQKTKAA